MAQVKWFELIERFREKKNIFLLSVQHPFFSTIQEVKKVLKMAIFGMKMFFESQKFSSEHHNMDNKLLKKLRSTSRNDPN